jgi:hypothetical protein
VKVKKNGNWSDATMVATISAIVWQNNFVKVG